MDISADCFDISPQFILVYSTIIDEHLILILSMRVIDQCCNVILYFCHASSVCNCFALLYGMLQKGSVA